MSGSKRLIVSTTSWRRSDQKVHASSKNGTQRVKVITFMASGRVESATGWDAAAATGASGSGALAAKDAGCATRPHVRDAGCVAVQPTVNVRRIDDTTIAGARIRFSWADMRWERPLL